MSLIDTAKSLDLASRAREGRAEDGICQGGVANQENVREWLRRSLGIAFDCGDKLRRAGCHPHGMVFDEKPLRVRVDQSREGYAKEVAGRHENEAIFGCHLVQPRGDQNTVQLLEN